MRRGERKLEIRLTGHNPNWSEVDSAVARTKEIWTSDRLAHWTKYPIASDINFANVKFNAAGDQVTCAFDWDAARVGYGFEDFFPGINPDRTAGRIALCGRFKNGTYLNLLIEYYQEASGIHFSVQERREIDASFEAQLLYHIAFTATRTPKPQNPKTQNPVYYALLVNGECN